MAVTFSPNRLCSCLCILLLALTALLSTSMLMGCKTKQPEPGVSVAPTPAKAARVPVTLVPAVKKHLYSAEADPKQEIAGALKQARREHKRVILDFGGDWCGDCQVLDIYFHQSPNAEMLAKHYVVVHVDIGRFDKNVDVAKKYDVPLKQGVPALAVVDADGKLLYAQKAGEFGDMRYMHANSVTEFLERWKA